ncbi:MAG: universal stress protein [Rhodoglobus sp.]
MSNQPSVVVGVSGPTLNDPAIEWALSYAQSLNAEVELVHVVDMSWRSTPATFAEAALLAAERELRDIATQCAARTSLPVHATVLVGHPTRLLVEHVANAAMLVLGTRRKENLGQLLFNTRATRVASKAGVSTVVVPNTVVPGKGIVVGVDGSELSAAPLAFAAREADRTSEPLTVIYSWYAPRPWTDGQFDGWPAEPEDEARRILAEATAGLAQTYPDLTVQAEVAFGRAASTLFTASEGATMLVVGSHGRQGLEKAWLGSTSEELILAMPTTVAIIR